MQCYTVYFIWKLLYVFRVVPPPIIRSANNCIYSIWYLLHCRYRGRVGTGLSVLWVVYTTHSTLCRHVHYKFIFVYLLLCFRFEISLWRVSRLRSSWLWHRAEWLMLVLLLEYSGRNFLRHCAESWIGERRYGHGRGLLWYTPAAETEENHARLRSE